MAEEKFSLTPILNENGEYSIKRYQEVEIACQNFIKERTISEVKNDDDLKALKEYRKEIRKKKDNISKTRKNLVKVFSYQFLSLEKMLNEADESMKKLKEEYELSLQEQQVQEELQQDTKTIIFKLNYSSEETLEKIRKIAVEDHCEIIEIKEK